MERMLNEGEIKNVTTLLQSFQKSHANWEEWRAKNWPEALSDKWLKCLAEIRKNGYINPQVIQGTLVFSQILTTNCKAVTDSCTTCVKRVDKGECMGMRATAERKINHNGKEYHVKKGDFVPCWLGNGKNERTPF